jgi:hypothetical protein
MESRYIPLLDAELLMMRVVDGEGRRGAGGR